ncbi:hypothetical protein Zmor_000217 [Zophobas morio]|uniref:Protein NATD1 n=1 Tax=Zophobas morio TaxID=2755281 RepID=A0AA38J0D2_9CUCU|nr:hypothetical protein Zmor_000217 [Zophobas morio]
MAASARMMSNIKRLLQAGKIRDDTHNGILSISFNSHVAEVEYERRGNVYDLTHTSIPDELQGHGLGTILAERIFDHLIQNNRKIKLTCEFLEQFYAKNEDKYSRYVVNDTD